MRSRSAAGASGSSGHGAKRRRLLGGAAAHLRVLRRSGSAVALGAGADARRRLDAPLPPDAGAGRHRGGAGGAVNVALVGLARLRRADTDVVVAADESAPRRCAAGGDDDRRARAAGPLLRGRARDRHRGRQDPARALGRLDRERGRRDRAALGSRGARPRPRAGHPVRHRRSESAAQGGPQRLWRGAGPALRAAQGAQRRRPSARPGAAGSQAAAT